MSKPHHKHSTEQRSHRLLYALTTITAVVFALFWTVGYDLPWAENPDYNAPLMTDAVLALMLLTTLGAACTAVWAAVRSVRLQQRGNGRENGVPTRRIALAITIGLLLVLALTWVLGSTTPLRINGKPFADSFWLRMADMWITTILLLLGTAVGAAIFGATRYVRRAKP